jgi:signal transduction histidine kinase
MYFTGLRSLVEIVVHQKRPAAQQRNVALGLALPDLLPGVEIHLDYIRDVLERLVDNAIKFSNSAQGHVLVSATANDRWVRITVKDNGIGISAEELPNLFKRMHQIDRAHLEQSGLGVGLAIAKGIAEIHGGRIDVESEVGRGSTFTLVLPVAQEALGPITL